MDTIKLNTPLTIEQIDFRIQSINNGGYATILAYKDARADMNRLDEVYGVTGWQKKYDIINGNLFCSVGIYNTETKEWIWKQDVGTESNTEKEKGQASDAFKRACFNFGIGRELYDYPLIQIKLEANEFEKKGDKNYATWNLKLKDWKWESEFNDKGQIIKLGCRDANSKVRWAWDIAKGAISATPNSPAPVSTPATAKAPATVMLTKAQFETAMKSDKKGILATLKAFNGQSGKAMTPEQTKSLTEQLSKAGLPELKENSPEWKSCVQKLSEGGTTDDLEKLFVISKELKEKLIASILN